MKIALIQTQLVWENPFENRKLLEQKIAMIPNVDLVVLPEMFTTGFTMEPNKVAEPMNGETVQWMQELAKRYDCALTGSVVISEGGNYYNRLLFIFPSGEVQQYDKRHLFSLAGEDKTYTKGLQKLVIDYKGFKISPLVCYDLRFPVFSRNAEGYDILIYVANWPEPRIAAWDTLLKARAIENMSYVIGVNRIGQDANGHHYTGHSQVVDYLGNYSIVPEESEGVFIAELNKKELLEIRQKFGFLNDRDNFTVI